MYVIQAANVLLIIVITFLLSRKEQSRERLLCWVALVIKISGAIALGIVYTYYYVEGDTFPYFHDSVRLANFAREDLRAYVCFLWETSSGDEFASTLNFQQPRAVYLAKIGSLFSLLSADNYWLIASWMAFISFLSCWYVCKEIRAYDERAFYPTLAAFFLIPSVVFWTSGFVKETLATAALNIIAIVFLRAWQRKKVSIAWVLLAVVATWMLWNLKYYYLAVLFPVLSSAIIYRIAYNFWLKKYSQVVRVLAFGLLFLVPLIIVSSLHPNFYPERLLSVITENHDAFIAISEERDVIHFNNLEPTIPSVLMNTPMAILSGLFRPFLWESENTMQLVSAVENAFILILFVSWIYSFILRDKRDKLGWIILLYSFALCAFLALSTPNFGTLSRYRTGFLPWLVLVFLYENRLVLNVWKYLRGVKS